MEVLLALLLLGIYGLKKSFTSKDQEKETKEDL